MAMGMRRIWFEVYVSEDVKKGMIFCLNVKVMDLRVPKS